MDGPKHKLLKMSWCAAVGCRNESKKNPDKSNFQLPKNENLKKTGIRLLNRTKLPNRVYICSDYFQESCFDSSWSMQSRLFYEDRRIKRKLIPGSIPSIFPHKAIQNERQTSKRRIQKRDRPQ
jgi:hypothetical protein